MRFGFKYAHFFTYDSAFEIDEILERENRLQCSETDFVGFVNDSRIMGDTGSINLTKLDFKELLLSGEIVEERLSELQHDDSLYIQKYFLENLRCHFTEFQHGDYRLGSEVSPRKAKEAEWALFLENGINLFIQNITGSNIDISVLTISGTNNYTVPPRTYFYHRIYEAGETGLFVLKINHQVISTIDLSAEDQRKYWVESTTFTKFSKKSKKMSNLNSV